MLPTKTEMVSVERTTATCEVCGKAAVVRQKEFEDGQTGMPNGRFYLEAARDPLNLSKNPEIVDLNYGSFSLDFREEVVFVEVPGAGAYKKRNLLVCSKCRNGHGDPLVIEAKVDPGAETQTLPPKKIVRICGTCKHHSRDLPKKNPCKSCHGYTQWEAKS